MRIGIDIGGTFTDFVLFNEETGVFRSYKALSTSGDPAQAAHIPVHLGSMPLSVLAGIRTLAFSPGDLAILNDPYHGDTHLPDITLITSIFIGEELLGFAANRAREWKWAPERLGNFHGKIFGIPFAQLKGKPVVPFTKYR